MASYYPPPHHAYPPPSGDRYGYSRDYDRDWGREREWADYERDRAEYERRQQWSERGRTRSPGLSPDDDRRAKRRRSPSPYDHDRYAPRPRYDDVGRSSPRRDYAVTRRFPVDPYAVDYPVTFKHFCEWVRFNNPDIDVEDKKELEKDPKADPDGRLLWSSRYDKYKKDLMSQQLHKLFKYHNKSAWFIERYDPSPEYVSQRARVRHEGWSGKLDAFITELDDGKWDPEVSLEVAQAKKGEPSREADGMQKDEEMGDEQGGPAESPTSPTGGEPSATDKEDMSPTSTRQAPTRASNLPASATAATGQGYFDQNGGEGRPGRGKPNIPPEEVMTVLPDGNQILIRTIPPLLQREKIEEVCRGVPGFVYLSLGDPQPKKGFYRPGWVKYDDTADMPSAVRYFADQRIDGFTMHVIHNTDPYPSRIRVAPAYASRLERMQSDLENVKKFAAVLENEWYDVQKKVKADEREARKRAAEAEKAAMDVDVDMDEEAKREATKQEVEQVEQELQADEKPQRGTELVARRAGKLVEDLRAKASAQGDERGEPVDGELLKAAEVRLELDLWLTYLRHAFHSCYYCALVCDHVEALQRKCVKHVRLPYIKPTPEEEAAEKENLVKKKPSDDRWVEWLDLRVPLLTKDGEKYKPENFGGISLDEEIAKIVKEHVKQEDEGKFRCKQCLKLFKAATFVEKHVQNKHPELLQGENFDIMPFFNNFAMDPNHLTPQQHTAGTNPRHPPSHSHDRPADNGRNASYGYPEQERGYGYSQPYANGGGYGYAAPMAQPVQWVNQPYYDDRRRASPPPNGRLADRMGDYAPPPDGDFALPNRPDGLPPKPTGALDMGREPPVLEGRRASRSNGRPPPPPPPNAREDPRAKSGRTSYQDMDQVAEGDVELTY